jgi:hypothetical protein
MNRQAIRQPLDLIDDLRSGLNSLVCFLSGEELFLVGFIPYATCIGGTGATIP